MNHALLAPKWLRENLVLQLGEGKSIRFWHHCWLTEKSLANIYPRLYHLSSNKEGFIQELGEWREGIWKWNLLWSRDLRGREKAMLENLISDIGNSCVTAGKEDGWYWKTDARGQFSVKSAYETLSSKVRGTRTNNEKKDWKLIWKAAAPLKAITTAWKVMKGRLATSDNLLKRQIDISSTDALCCFCKLSIETVNHLFFECTKSENLWKEILSWVGRQAPLHHRAQDHLTAFINLGNKEANRLLLSLWTCVVWCIWKARNECKFNEGDWCKERIIQEIKARQWSWLSAFTISSTETDFRRWRAAINLGS